MDVAAKKMYLRKRKKSRLGGSSEPGAAVAVPEGPRVKGTVVGWRGDRGFGFIAPLDGGEDVFCHAKDITDGTCLQPGSTVEYTVHWDERKGKGKGKGKGTSAKHLTGGSSEPGGGGGAVPEGRRVKGEVAGWTEDRGFGFITPLDGGGEDVFCHANDITDGDCLQEGSTVEYTLRWDERKEKYSAVDVVTSGSNDAGGGRGGGVVGGESWRGDRARQSDDWGPRAGTAHGMPGMPPPQHPPPAAAGPVPPLRLLPISYEARTRITAACYPHQVETGPYFVPGLTHVVRIELRQALVSYQDYHTLLLTLAGLGTRTRAWSAFRWRCGTPWSRTLRMRIWLSERRKWSRHPRRRRRHRVSAGQVVVAAA